VTNSSALGVHGRIGNRAGPADPFRRDEDRATLGLLVDPSQIFSKRAESKEPDAGEGCDRRDR